MDEMKKPFEIELPPDKAEGTYSNMVVISHSASEIIIDFARIMPGVPKARVQSRIIMTPQHAKGLLKTLEENLKKYEAQFGEIKIPGGDEKRVGF